MAARSRARRAGTSATGLLVSQAEVSERLHKGRHVQGGCALLHCFLRVRMVPLISFHLYSPGGQIFSPRHSKFKSLFQ